MKPIFATASLFAMAYMLTSAYANAADYRESYGEQHYVQTEPQGPYQSPYQSPAQSTQQTVIVNQTPSQPQVIYVERRHAWNPIGAIMAVPRAALAVPGAILGGDDYYDQD